MAGADWQRWWPEFAKACDGSHHTIETIEAQLANGSTCLLERGGCAYIVSIEKYPTQTACQVWWAAGDLQGLVDQLPLVHEWARTNGCTEMLIEGAPAWQKALQPLGYRTWSVTLRKALPDGN